MAEMWYDFSEHLDSIQWINELPNGLVSERVNLNHNHVSIQNKEGMYTIYIGPKEPDKGGDGILITLDKDMNLVDYVIERIEPVPTDNE